MPTTAASKLLLPLALLAPLASSCVHTSIYGSGVLLQEERAAEDFHAVHASGAVKLQARVGEAPSIRVQGDDNIVPLLHTDVSGGTLRIRLESGSYSTRQPLEVHVTTPALDRVVLSGACSADVDGVDADRFRADLSGACHLTVSGRADELDAQCSGASTARLSALQVREASVRTSGASNAYVHATEALHARSSGASDIRYRGRPKVSVSTSGASSVRGED